MYTQKEVNKIFRHIPVKTLRWWGEKQLYGWASESKDGRGTHRLYELSNLYQIGIVENLAGLNIPTEVIRLFMTKHFRHGMRMTIPPFYGANELVAQKDFSIVNVVDQMDKNLLIIKEYKYDIDKNIKTSFDWLSKLVDSANISDEAIEYRIDKKQYLLGEEWYYNTVIVIILSMIREFVEYLITEVANIIHSRCPICSGNILE
jgi:DNA-binding transcriptional MerR regulator